MLINKRPWGEWEGREIWLFEIAAEDGLRACVSNYGGVLQSLIVKDKNGNDADVVLGYDTLGEYIRSDTFFGAMIGPIADRMHHGSCEVDGVRVQLELNAGPDSMHSGPKGFHSRAWDWEILEDGVAFTRCFTPDDYGFPGSMDVRLAYRVQGNTLRLEYSAGCDREFAVSFTNHSYFSLNGGKGHCRDQQLRICASAYARTRRDSDPICTGETPCTAGTPFDLANGQKIGEVVARTDFSEVRTGGGIDHYFPVDGEGMRLHARLECAESGIALNCVSDAPGLLVYTANGLEDEKGKGSAVYGRNWGVCLETGRFPNAVNLPALRGTVVQPAGSRYESATEYIFEN